MYYLRMTDLSSGSSDAAFSAWSFRQERYIRSGMFVRAKLFNGDRNFTSKKKKVNQMLLSGNTGMISPLNMKEVLHYSGVSTGGC